MPEYQVYENGDILDSCIVAESPDDALSQAKQGVDPSVYRDSETVFVYVRVIDSEGGLYEDVVEVGPEIPDCANPDQEHEWESPHEVVGGSTTNPGVFGHLGGVKAIEVCKHCGTYKKVNTWYQCPATGREGLFHLCYADPDEESKAWVESLNDSE